MNSILQSQKSKEYVIIVIASIGEALELEAVKINVVWIHYCIVLIVNI